MVHLMLSLLGLLVSAQMGTDAADLLTVAEKSEYKATARYDEVIAFIDRLARKSPIVRRGELGTSFEGRSIPLLILADPPISTPREAADSGKLVVFAFGNIHAGEVCGKEALLMLARDIATTPDHPLLSKLVIILAPIFNPDGNERVSKDNRPGQDGPAHGMGQRANAQGLDLNRDYIKLESPEVRAMVRFYNQWDPAVIIDTHTTNGSHHQYIITYAGPRNPAGDAGVIEYVRDTMLPAVSQALRKQAGYKSFFYGNFDREHTRWSTYPASPRFGTPYRGLRNRIAILSEAYSYAPYRDRVLATGEFVRCCLEYSATHKDEIHDLLEAADKRTVQAGQHPRKDDLVGIQHKLAPFEKKVRIEGFVEQETAGRPISTGQPRTYEVDHHGRSVPTLSVRRPYAYLFPPSLKGVLHKLQQHGIALEELGRDTELDVQVYSITGIDRAERSFQKHNLVTVNATPRMETRRMRAGTIVVRTGQKLGALAVYLLEPQSEDGLCTWNYFDDALGAGREFPVVRVLDPISLASDRVPLPPQDRDSDTPAAPVRRGPG